MDRRSAASPPLFLLLCVGSQHMPAVIALGSVRGPWFFLLYFFTRWLLCQLVITTTVHLTVGEEEEEHLFSYADRVFDLGAISCGIRSSPLWRRRRTRQLVSSSRIWQTNLPREKRERETR